MITATTIASSILVVVAVIIIKLKLITNKEKSMSLMKVVPSEVAAELEGMISTTDKDLTRRGMKLPVLMNMVMGLQNTKNKTNIIMIDEGKIIIKIVKVTLKTNPNTIDRTNNILRRSAMTSICTKNVREITKN